MCAKSVPGLQRSEEVVRSDLLELEVLMTVSHHRVLQDPSPL